MTNTREYRTTTNRSVYNKLYKEYNAHCSYCKWHGPSSENDRYKCYYIREWNNKKKAKYPNWKLVSKNQKQWMKKPLIFKSSINPYSPWTYWIDIEWPSKIRPK